MAMADSASHWCSTTNQVDQWLQFEHAKQPLTIRVESLQRSLERFNFNVTLSNQETLDDGNFNCFIDRTYDSGCKKAFNEPWCCYNLIKPHVFEHLACSANCRINDAERTAMVQPCRAVCFNALEYHLGFSINDTTIELQISATYQTRSYLQGYTPLTGEYFDLLDGVNQSSTYINGFMIEDTAALTEYVGIWIKYDNKLRLHVGQDGMNIPFAKVNFREQAIDGTGWTGTEVINRTNIFAPDLFRVSSTQGNVVEIGLNCSDIIYSRFGQEQPSLGGTCLIDGQCPQGSRCGTTSKSKVSRCIKSVVGSRKNLLYQDWAVEVIVILIIFSVVSVVTVAFATYCDKKQMRPGLVLSLIVRSLRARSCPI